MKRKIFALILACLILSVCLAGCGASKNAYDSAVAETNGSYYYADSKSSESYDYAYEEDGYYDAPEEGEYASSTSDISSMAIDSALSSSRKIILYADVNVETHDFNASVAALTEAVESLGGYISTANTSIYNTTYSLHSGTYTVRIPCENFNAFISKSDTMGNVTDSNIWQDDVTSRYTDIETRLATLETKRDRLLAMMEEATEMADIIQLEDALTDTVYMIESLTGERNVYDDRIAYSTATVYLREVRVYTEIVTPPKTLGERISQTFSSSIKDFGDFCEDTIVFLVGALPTILVLAVIAAVIILIIRRGAPRRAARREERRERAKAAAEEFRAKRNEELKTAVEKTQDEENK